MSEHDSETSAKIGLWTTRACQTMKRKIHVAIKIFLVV